MRKAINNIFILALLLGGLLIIESANIRKFQKTLAKSDKIIVAKLNNNTLELLQNKIPDEDTDYASILFEEDQLIYVPSSEPVIVSSLTCATISYRRTIASTGWNKLHLRTYDHCTPYIQARAAGILEGIVTHKDITSFHINMVRNLAPGESNRINDVRRQFENINEHLINRLSDKSIEDLENKERKYYNQILIGYAQFQGIWEGQKLVSPSPLELFDLYLINADGQISELEQAFNEENLNKMNERADSLIQIIPRFNKKLLFKRNKVQNAKEYWRKRLTKSRCSALIKLVKSEDGKIRDVFAGHNTWESYHEMLRIYKIYDFQIIPDEENSVTFLKNHRLAFSAYPGTISSTDDFYLSNGELLIMETTLDIPNIGLLSNILPAGKYIPDFMRVLAATRLSKSAVDWVDWFSFVNTGTYNSQWMILDVQKIGEIINTQNQIRGAFYVLEQMPGKISTEDMTDHLMENTYWASFNVPYFQNTRTVTGFTQLTKGRFGRLFSRINNPRARAFSIYQGQVDSLEKMKKIMQINKYKSDSFESFVSEEDRNYLKTQTEQISSRFDLGTKIEFGGVDTKIASHSMMANLETLIIGGPSKDDQKSFNFSEGFQGYYHQGIPEEWNFDWLSINPENIGS